MKSAEILNILAKLADSEDSEDNDDVSHLPIDIQRETLISAYKNNTNFKVGDEIRLNNLGRNRYKLPNKSTVAYIASVFDKPMLDESGNVVHGEMVCMPTRNMVRFFAIDFRCYDRV